MPSEDHRSLTPTPIVDQKPSYQQGRSSSDIASVTTVAKKRSSTSMDEKWSRKSVDAETTTLYAASTIGGMSITKSFQSLPTRGLGGLSSASSSSEDLPFQGRFSRSELSRVLGEEAIIHTAEIETIPCAGIRISYGRLCGLMAWRFVVRFPGVKTPRTKSVVGNFILDTGAQTSHIAPQILSALDYKGDMTPGQSVKLCIQGVEHQCVVGEYGEASTLSADYLISGGLALHFAWRMDAPILYVESSKLLADVPRTISRRYSIQEKVMSLIDKVRPRSKYPDS
ncbi:hypothetical protein AX16_002462 [Volvariella volvacea WC 439]|nr:hypothetical protein AX16_002462 [Volvariella volvacea WC 439]